MYTRAFDPVTGYEVSVPENRLQAFPGRFEPIREEEFYREPTLPVKAPEPSGAGSKKKEES